LRLQPAINRPRVLARSPLSRRGAAFAVAAAMLTAAAGLPHLAAADSVVCDYAGSSKCIDTLGATGPIASPYAGKITLPAGTTAITDEMSYHVAGDSWYTLAGDYELDLQDVTSGTVLQQVLYTVNTDTNAYPSTVSTTPSTVALNSAILGSAGSNAGEIGYTLYIKETIALRAPIGSGNGEINTSKNEIWYYGSAGTLASVAATTSHPFAGPTAPPSPPGAGASPTPSPTPSAGGSPSPTPSPTPSLSTAGSPSPTPGTSPSPSAAASPSPSPGAPSTVATSPSPGQGAGGSGATSPAAVTGGGGSASPAGSGTLAASTVAGTGAGAGITSAAPVIRTPITGRAAWLRQLLVGLALILAGGAGVFLARRRRLARS